MSIFDHVDDLGRACRAELVLDLYDLCHQARFGSKPTDLELLGRVRGLSDEASLRSILRRIRAFLHEHGLALETVEVEGTKIQGNNRQRTRLDFDVEALGAFVDENVDEATEIIERYRKKTGIAWERIRPNMLADPVERGRKREVRQRKHLLQKLASTFVAVREARVAEIAEECDEQAEIEAVEERYLNPENVELVSEPLVAEPVAEELVEPDLVEVNGCTIAARALAHDTREEIDRFVERSKPKRRPWGGWSVKPAPQVTEPKKEDPKVNETDVEEHRVENDEPAAEPEPIACREKGCDFVGTRAQLAGHRNKHANAAKKKPASPEDLAARRAANAERERARRAARAAEARAVAPAAPFGPREAYDACRVALDKLTPAGKKALLEFLVATETPAAL